MMAKFCPAMTRLAMRATPGLTATMRLMVPVPAELRLAGDTMVTQLGTPVMDQGHPVLLVTVML